MGIKTPSNKSLQPTSLRSAAELSRQPNRMSLLHNIARRLRGPNCHLLPEQKAWVEDRMLWLLTQFGAGPIRRSPLSPASDLLPRKWDRSEEAGADLFRRLCTFMLLDPARLELNFYSCRETHNLESAYAGESTRSGPVGLFIHPKDRQRLVIALEDSGFEDPAALTATICHELGHVHLLADHRIQPDTPDSEPLTDLLTVFFGAGIFTANSVFQFSQWQSHSHQGWRASRLGYLSEELFGYALAAYAWYRGELAPSWQTHLRSNILYYFDDSLHFLSTTRETKVPFNAAEPGGAANRSQPVGPETDPMSPMAGPGG